MSHALLFLAQPAYDPEETLDNFALYDDMRYAIDISVAS